MTQPKHENPSFNLWHEPWISVETRAGRLTRLGIQDVLVNAHEYVALYDVSPLVVVGIQRLLTAILQDALAPKNKAQLETLWEQGKFPQEKIESFGKRYADRFDLFSEDKPFLQSADLARFPKAKEEQKEATTVARLFMETPSGTFVTHYRHITEREHVYSPAVAAAGLIAMPPFASSGGSGFMPSINGVPPIYILPGGATLFEILARSLIAENVLADQYPDQDYPWWQRKVPSKVEQSKKGQKQLARVGYLHGLTFPARKVRLHPERLNNVCARSGEKSEWMVRTMAFKMGESLREDAPIWQDPFVAYKLPAPPKEKGKRKIQVKPKKKRERETPIRPTRGKAAWREFSGLFLQRADKSQQTKRPLFISQLSQLVESHQDILTYPFRCIAIQTKGQAKIFEWLDFGFDVPPALLQDPDGARWAERALDFAAQAASTIARVFVGAFGDKSKNAEKFKRLKERMEADYWAELASAFRQFILDLGDVTAQPQTLEKWYGTTTRSAQKQFEQAADATGDDGNALKHIVQGKQRCARALGKLQAQFEQGGNDG